MIKKVSIILLFFLYIYTVSFFFLPAIIQTRVIIGIVGIFYFMLFVRKIYFSKHLVLLFIVFLGFLFIVMITTIINGHFDNRFVGNVFQNIIYLFGALWMSEVVKKNWAENYSFIGIAKIIVWAIAINSAMSIIMFVHPPLMLFINSIQNFDQTHYRVVQGVLMVGTRFIGIGSGTFFTGGVYAATALVLITFIITHSVKNQFLWIVLYIFITITGLFIARITIVGNVISFLMIGYYWMHTSSLSANMKRLFFTVTAIVVMLSAFNHYAYIHQNDPLFQHGLELFLGFQSSGLGTETTNIVREMLRFPDTTKSFLIGDGRFVNPDGSYYMHTDVGFARLMWYWGIFGTIIYFVPQLIMSNILWRKERKTYQFLTFTLLLFFALTMSFNLKGITDLNWLFYLLSVRYLFVVKSSVKCNEIAKTNI